MDLFVFKILAETDIMGLVSARIVATGCHALLPHLFYVV